MRTLLAAAAAVLALATTCQAKDVSLTLTDGDQASFGMLPTLIEQCAGAAAMRADAATCRNVHAYALSLQERVRASVAAEAAAKPAPAPAAPEQQPAGAQ